MAVKKNAECEIIIKVEKNKLYYQKKKDVYIRCWNIHIDDNKLN